MKKGSQIVKEIAAERMEGLITMAKSREMTSGSQVFRKRYVEIARSISRHYKVRMPKRLKDSICKRCGDVLIPGETCTVRLASSKGYIAYRCACGAERHIFC
jgi:RNase P subunit RPR2